MEKPTYNYKFVQRKNLVIEEKITVCTEERSITSTEIQEKIVDLQNEINRLEDVKKVIIVEELNIDKELPQFVT